MDVTVEDIRDWHKQRGWSDIGYNYLIDRQGRLQKGRDIDGDGDVDEEIGAHAYGFNASSIGIALAGGDDKFNFTLKQIICLKKTVDKIKERIPTITKVIGHNDVSDKACPCFDVQYLLGDE